MEIDSSGNPWGPRGQCTLSFHGVRLAEGLGKCVGTWWLYEEVHLHPEAAFDYRVLLGIGAEPEELRIVANEVDFQVREPSPVPVVGVDIPFQGEDGLYIWSNLDEAGAQMGWYCIRDGRKTAEIPPAEVLEKMRQFALATGAAVAGD